jgi:integrase
VVGKGTKVVLVPLPPAVAPAIDRAVGNRTGGPILLNTRGTRMVRHVATRRRCRLAEVAGVRLPRKHPHMPRHTFVTTMLDAGVDLRDVQIAARHADPRTTMRYDRARKNLDRHPNYILAATWHREPERHRQEVPDALGGAHGSKRFVDQDASGSVTPSEASTVATRERTLVALDRHP